MVLSIIYGALEFIVIKFIIILSVSLARSVPLFVVLWAPRPSLLSVFYFFFPACVPLSVRWFGTAMDPLVGRACLEIVSPSNFIAGHPIRHSAARGFVLPSPIERRTRRNTLV